LFPFVALTAALLDEPMPVWLPPGAAPPGLRHSPCCAAGGCCPEGGRVVDLLDLFRLVRRQPDAKRDDAFTNYLKKIRGWGIDHQPHGYPTHAARLGEARVIVVREASASTSHLAPYLTGDGDWGLLARVGRPRADTA